MPTLIEISDDLAQKFVEADNKKYAARHILNEINSLVYPSSKQPIDDGVKIVIVQTIFELISGKRPFKSTLNKEIHIKPQHIDIFVSASEKLFKKGTPDASLSKKRKTFTYLSVYNFARKVQK